MIFGYFTLAVALAISAVAAYYSIVGLTAIFAAATIPIIIMGVVLEVGKVTAAVWLKLNWHRAALIYKLYLIPAVGILMLLTSMGIFGFLSKSHLDQSVPSTNIAAQVALLDERISVEKENINVARKALQQLDKTIDETIARSTSEGGVARAANLRRTQQAERGRLQRDIENAQNNISKYTEEQQPLAQQLRVVEAKVGPIKYIAALIYDDTLDNSILEKAVRLVIIIIVAVFDPLALILIIAAQQSIRWAREEANKKVISTQEIKSEESSPAVESVKTEVASSTVENDERIYDPNKLSYLRSFAHFKNLQPSVFREQAKTFEEPQVNSFESNNTEEVNSSSSEVSLPVETTRTENQSENEKSKIPETAERYKAPLPVIPETMNVRKQLDQNTNPSNSSFGTELPQRAKKGDTFLRVDLKPNKLYKFNGFKWIEIDKSRSDSYSYDEKYIDFLIEKISNGEYDIDQLSSLEQEMITEKLKRTHDNT